MFELGSDFDSVPDLTLRPVFATKPGYQLGDNVVAGDFNGDDTTDLVVNLRPNPNYYERGSLYFYWGGVGFDTVPDFIIQESFHTASNRILGYPQFLGNRDIGHAAVFLQQTNQSTIQVVQLFFGGIISHIAFFSSNF